MLDLFSPIKPGTDAIMLRLNTLLCGALVGSVITALTLLMLQPDRNDAEAERWHEAAHETESQLASTRHHLPSPSTQFSSSTRLESVLQPSVNTSAFAQGRVPASIESFSPPPAVPPPSLIAPERQHEWNALVTGTLQAEVQRRLGRRLPEEQQRRLVDTLTRLRDASLALNQDPLDEADPSFLSDHLMGTIALLEADRTFRNELGIGVSEFIGGLDRSQIEEVTTAPAKSKK
jgi:hypothetical protein